MSIEKISPANLAMIIKLAASISGGALSVSAITALSAFIPAIGAAALIAGPSTFIIALLAVRAFINNNKVSIIRKLKQAAEDNEIDSKEFEELLIKINELTTDK